MRPRGSVCHIATQYTRPGVCEVRVRGSYKCLHSWELNFNIDVYIHILKEIYIQFDYDQLYIRLWNYTESPVVKKIRASQHPGL